MSEERKKIWIHLIQTRLLVRLGMYWFVSQVCLWNLVFVWRLLQEGPGEPLQQYGRFLQDFFPAILGSLLLFPVLALDAVKFAHRVVGPVHSFRQTLQAVAAGTPVRPVRLRQNDFLGEVRDDINHMLDHLQRQGVPVLKPAQPEGEATPRQTA